jgi:hypothetical protein
LWLSIALLTILAVIFWAFFLDDSFDMYSMMGWRWFSGFGFFMFPSLFWLIIIFVILFSGLQSYKKTSVGYRHSFMKNLLIWLGIVIVSAFIFRAVGVGPRMHAYLIDNFPSISWVVYQQSAWNDPLNGRLSGDITRITPETLILKDIDGKIWNISTAWSFISPMASVDIGEKIRILWTKKSESSFVAERIMPWFGGWMGNWFWAWRGMMWGGRWMMRNQ